MFKREEYCKDINFRLSYIRTYISQANTIGMYDVDKFAEDFCAGLLNEIEQWNLINLNYTMKNAIAIDLADIERKIAVQVTADNSSQKIKHTINEFVENELYKQYTRLLILLLSEKKKYTTTFETDSTFVFDKNRDIIDFNHLFKRISSLDLEQLHGIGEYLDSEMKMICSKETVDRYQACSLEKIKEFKTEMEDIVLKIEKLSLRIGTTTDDDLRKILQTQYNLYKQMLFSIQRDIDGLTNNQIDRPLGYGIKKESSNTPSAKSYNKHGLLFLLVPAILACILLYQLSKWVFTIKLVKVIGVILLILSVLAVILLMFMRGSRSPRPGGDIDHRDTTTFNEDSWAHYRTNAIESMQSVENSLNFLREQLNQLE